MLERWKDRGCAGISHCLKQAIAVVGDRVEPVEATLATIIPRRKDRYLTRNFCEVHYTRLSAPWNNVPRCASDASDVPVVVDERPGSIQGVLEELGVIRS